MASVNNQTDEDLKNQQSTPVGGTSGAEADAGSPNAPGGGAPASPVKQNASAQNQSGYTDVGSYLNANQGGAQKMGDQVASNLTNQYNTTKSGIDTSANDLINSVNQGYTKENTDLIKQAAADPNAYANNKDQLAAFQGQLNDSYSGPNSWGDYGTQQGNVANAQQYGNLATTPGGMNVYAQQLEGPTASQGVNQLDSLLLGGNEGSANAVKNAAKPLNTLGDYLDSQNTAATGAITSGQTAAQNASQDALNAFTGANGTLTNLNSTINANAAKTLADAQAQQKALTGDISNLYGGQAVDNTPTALGVYGGGTTPWYNTTNYTVGQLSPQDLASLGITQDQWNNLQGSMQQAGTTEGRSGHNFGAQSPTSQIDLSQYLQQQDPTQLINAGNTATPEQYAQMQSIQTLLGGKTPQGNAINPALASLAGTYNPAQLNQFDYNAAQSNASGTAAQERQAAQDEANAITAGADAAHAASKQHGISGAFNRLVPNAAKYLLNPLTAVSPEIKETKKYI